MSKEKADAKLAKEVIEEQRYYETIFNTFPKEKQIMILIMQRDFMRLIARSTNQMIKRLKEEDK